MNRIGFMIGGMILVGSVVLGLGVFGSNFVPRVTLMVEHPPDYVLVQPKPYAAHPDEAWSMCHAAVGKSTFVFEGRNGRYEVTRTVSAKTEGLFIDPEAEGRLVSD